MAAGILICVKQVISMRQDVVLMHTTVNSRPAVVVLLGASTSQARTNDATNLLNWVASPPKRI